MKSVQGIIVKYLVAAGATGLFAILLLFLIPKVTGLKTMDITEGRVHMTDPATVFKLTRNAVAEEYPLIHYSVNNITYYYFKRNEVLFRKLKEGEILKIIYKNEDPGEAYIKNLFGYWLPLPNIILIIFFSFLWLGILYIKIKL